MVPTTSHTPTSSLSPTAIFSARRTAQPQLRSCFVSLELDDELAGLYRLVLTLEPPSDRRLSDRLASYGTCISIGTFHLVLLSLLRLIGK